MTLMMKEIGDQPYVLKKVLLENSEKIKELCLEIKNRNIKFLYIAARGTSDHAAVYMKYILETFVGIPVAFAAPSVITVYGGKPNLEDALVVGISQSGKAEDVLEIIRHARSQGALTATVTNYENSPLAVESQYHFNCYAGEEKSVAATKTFTAQMMVMAMITAELSDNDNLLKELRQVPAKLNELIKETGSIAEVACKFISMEECFVLSRGTNYSIALEGALKIQETCYVRAKAYAISDFYHGPLALLDEKIPVFVIAPKGKISGNSEELMKVLNNYGIQTVAVTDDASVSEKASFVISIPPGLTDFTTPFLSAVAMQIFACKLSLAKGLDPDNPRNIKKVTITR